MPLGAPVNVRYEVRALIKELIWWLTNGHRPGDQPNIALFATRRGGSTWLMEIIAANSGIKYINQPLSVETVGLTAAQFRRMPFAMGELVALDDTSEERLRTYLEAVLSGELPVNAPTRFWRRDFRFRTNRLVLKCVAGKPVIDWIATNFELNIVYLTRHPIPQALSCMRNSWRLHLAGFLDSNAFCSMHLGDALGFCNDIASDGSELDRYVLNWALENVVPARLLPERPEWLHVRYEDTVVSPEAVIEKVADRLGLADLDAMRARIDVPSLSSAISTDVARRKIVAGDRESLAFGWRNDVSDDDVRSAMRILERLGIDLY